MSGLEAHQLASLQSVTYAPANSTLLNKLDFTLTQHGVTAIMGPNGAGKSTLLRLLAGLLQPTSGKISWPNPAPPTPNGRAFVFQRPVILRRSVSANVYHAIAPLKLTKVEATKRVSTSLAVCDLEHLHDAPARRLSGGEQQRLAMARALARQPKVLLLDEPTASLDPASTKAIEQITLQSMKDGTKVILVTHDAGQARRLASDVIFLNAGHIVEHTPATVFFSNPASQPARDYLDGRITTVEN